MDCFWRPALLFWHLISAMIRAQDEGEIMPPEREREREGRRERERDSIQFIQDLIY